jgi:hypothetical protein
VKKAYNLRSRPERAGLTKTSCFARGMAESSCQPDYTKHRVQRAKVNALPTISRINY